MSFLRRIGRHSAPRSRGQALVEFAFVLPMFVFLLLILLDFGRVVYTQHTITEDAREGVRIGIAAPDLRAAAAIHHDGTACSGDPYQCLYDDIRAAALQLSQGTGLQASEITGQAGRSCTLAGITADSVSPSTCFYPFGVDPGAPVEVNITTQVQIITPIISNLVGGAFTVTGKAISFMP